MRFMRLPGFAIAASVLLTSVAAHDAFAAATMTIIPGAGFSDATPAAPVGGNTGTTVGAQRLIALQHAADLWGAMLTSSEPIRIDAAFGPLSCSSGGGVLGQAGANTYFRDFAGAPLANTWYPAALANAISGSDLCPPSSPCTTAGNDPEDINAAFQINLGTGGCLPSSSFYYGLDANPGSGQIDFVTIALHELGHGLGFLTLVNLSTGAKASGSDDIYMTFLEDHSTTQLWPAMTDTQRKNSATDSPGGISDLHWTGANVVAAGALVTGCRHVSGHIMMYAPSALQNGSSVSHFDTSCTPDEIMEPSYTVATHNVGLTDDLMKDLGWTVGPGQTTTPTPTPTVTPTATPVGDHFTCYKAGQTSGFPKFAGIPSIPLVDQFGSSAVEVKKPKYLCAPTNKNGEDPTAPSHTEHLKGYQIKNAAAPTFPTSIQIIDQFNPGGLLVDAKKQSHLLVPSMKSLSMTPPTPPAFVTDHFECYKIVGTKGTPKFPGIPSVVVQDQFGTMTVQVKKPKFLCNPVNKNGEDPSAPTHVNHLVCYQVKQLDLVKFAKITSVFVNNQFGPETLDAKKPSELCLPALKNP